MAGYSVYRNKQHQDKINGLALRALGASAASAGCGPIKQKDATGAGQHTTAKVLYATTPPSFGPHNPTPDGSGLHFFTTTDRPPVEVLVHNLEHGWTIAWYDDTVAKDKVEMQALKDTAAKFDQHANDPHYNMIIAPWTKSDGDGQPIPDGKHIAFTHWSVHQPVYNASFYRTAEIQRQVLWREPVLLDLLGGCSQRFHEEVPLRRRAGRVPLAPVTAAVSEKILR